MKHLYDPEFDRDTRLNPFEIRAGLKPNPGEKQAKRVGKPSTLDTDPDVRRKAKSAL